jgi:ribose transport system substrate-binding protein
MKKKISAKLIATIVSLMLLSIIAISCSPATTVAPTTAPVATTAPTVTQTKTYVVGLSNFSLGNSWRVQMVAEAEYAAKNNPLVKQLIVTQANESIEKQIADIEDLITKKVDILLITAMNPTGLIPVIDKAMAAGIVVVDFDNQDATDNITAHITVDQKEFGSTQATWLAKAMNNKGGVIVFNGMKGTQISADRHDGAVAVLNKYPDIKILDEVYADWDYAKAKTAMESLLTTYPKIDGIQSQGGAMSQAAIEAFQEKGLPIPPVTGEDGNGFLKLWKKLHDANGYDSIATSMPTWCSAKALEVALNAVQGKPYDKITPIPIPTITADTLDQYVRPNLSDSFWCNSHLPDDIVMALFPK